MDSLPLVEVTSRELRSRLKLLDAELEQLSHDEEHIRTDCYGSEQVFHMRKIARERSEATSKKSRYAEELSRRSP